MKALNLQNVKHSNWTGEESNVALHIYEAGFKFWFNFYDIKFTCTVAYVLTVCGEDTYRVTVEGAGWTDPLTSLYVDVPEGTTDRQIIIDAAARDAVAWIANHI